ncbi:MAG: hypothetical protein ACREOU_16595 [Candidatus Eiseniibacteriota bacterium]
MNPRTRSLVLILAFPLLAAANPCAGGPITGNAQPAPATRALPSARDEGGARGVVPLTHDLAGVSKAGAAIVRTPEEEALLAIRDEAQARIRELAQRYTATLDPAERFDLLQRASEIKKQADVRFLETKISFARSRGDLRSVNELGMMLERLIHPPARTTPVEPQSQVKGGAK